MQGGGVMKKKMILCSVVFIAFFCFAGSLFGQDVYRFDGKKAIHQRSDTVGLAMSDKASIQQSQEQISAQSPVHSSIGLTVFTVASSGMTLFFNEGSFGDLYYFKYSSEAKTYSWVLLNNYDISSDGAYAMVTGNYYADNNINEVNYSFRGIFDNPAHFLFQFSPVSRAELLKLGVFSLPQYDSGAIYNFGYLSNMTTMTVDRIVGIDNTISHEIGGGYMINHVLAIVLPTSDVGGLDTVLTLEQAKMSKVVMRDKQLFGLIITKTPSPY
jgi:hypothetical protein